MFKFVQNKEEGTQTDIYAKLAHTASEIHLLDQSEISRWPRPVVDHASCDGTNGALWWDEWYQWCLWLVCGECNGKPQSTFTVKKVVLKYTEK